MSESNNASNNFYRVSIKALIINQKKEFLLGFDPILGAWGFPGGGLDHGENQKDCLRREIKEEMGIKILSISEYPSYTTSVIRNDGIPAIHIFYEVTLQNYNNTPSRECAKLSFFNATSLQKIKRFSAIDTFVKVYDPNNH